VVEGSSRILYVNGKARTLASSRVHGMVARVVLLAQDACGNRRASGRNFGDHRSTVRDIPLLPPIPCGAQTVVSGPADETNPRVSPDGKR
jgi:hypothetical protein